MSAVALVVLGSSTLTVLMSCASIHFSRRARKSWDARTFEYVETVKVVAS